MLLTICFLSPSVFLSLSSFSRVIGKTLHILWSGPLFHHNNVIWELQCAIQCVRDRNTFDTNHAFGRRVSDTIKGSCNGSLAIRAAPIGIRRPTVGDWNSPTDDLRISHHPKCRQIILPCPSGKLF